MADDWKEYQEEAAEFFRSLGLTAETDVTLTGVRTTHDVDVVVRSKHVGFEVLWQALEVARHQAPRAGAEGDRERSWSRSRHTPVRSRFSGGRNRSCVKRAGGA